MTALNATDARASLPGAEIGVMEAWAAVIEG